MIHVGFCEISSAQTTSLKFQPFECWVISKNRSLLSSVAENLETQLVFGLGMID